MPWRLYRTHEIENQIAATYQAYGIHSPTDMKLDRIAAAFGVIYSFYHGRSLVHYDEKQKPAILIDERTTEPEQRADFFHELCHPLRHAGCQTKMPRLFKELQELQAAQFQIYAAMPWFMIQAMPLPQIDHEIIALWASEFKVTPALAAKRLEQIRRRILARKLEMESFISAPETPPKPKEEPGSIIVTHPETERLLQQLYHQTIKPRWRVQNG